ncbi:odorant receptor 49b-like [Melanaphis sacchari]|uniref:odorant receptor 49b-like n=1 Tax=Melanaphis sacchari TaxID=742174 RepID=UPI000DC139A0|nr:odorant receptor 49b-like [Melanaphis sacchari]
MTFIENKNYHRKFYKTLMTLAFSLNTSQYHCISKCILYFYIFDWMVFVFLAAGCVLLYEKPDMSFGMELIQYMIVGVLYTLIFLVFIIKKDAIVSNYNFIQTKFIHWSNKRLLHPNIAYKKNIRTVKRLIIPLVILSLSIAFGPLVSTINDIGKLPLNSRTHFVLFWPKIVDTNKISTYGIIYTVQIVLTVILYISTLSFNLGFMVFLNELTNQFEILLDGIDNAFKFKRDKQFQLFFIDCIRHHQIIIKFLDDLKSYFKWIVLIEIIIVQVVLAILIYNLTKVTASLGYKVKIVGSLLFNILPICFHCHIGEVILSLHTRLSNHIYNMIWYDMPNKNKQLIVIMFQRTQRDLALSSALFSNERASRSLISKVIKQVYTILNVLLKT